MKTNISAHVEESIVKRIQRVASKQLSTQSLIAGECIRKYLPRLERKAFGQKPQPKNGKGTK